MAPQRARTHLLLLAFVVVLPLFALVVLFAAQNVARARAEIEKDAVDTARQIRQVASRELSVLVTTLKAAASCPCLKNGNLPQFETLVGLIERHAGMTVSLQGPATAAGDGTSEPVDIRFTPERTGGEVTILARAPVEEGTAYMLAGTLSQRAFMRGFSGFPIPDGQSAMLRDPHGNMLTVLGASRTDEPRLLGSPDAAPSQRTDIVANADGSLTAVAVPSELGVAALVRVPAANLEMPLAQSIRSVSLLGTVAIGFAMLFALAFGSRLNAAIAELAKAAEEAREGLDHGPVKTAITEVNDIAVGLSAAVQQQRKRLLQRDRAYERLALQEAQLRAILDTAPVPLIIVDRSGTVISFSYTAEKLFGWSRREIIGQPLSDLLKPTAESATGDSILQILADESDSPPPRLVTAVSREGLEMPAEVALRAVHVHGQSFWVVFVRDLREEERIQAELQHGQRLEALGQLTGGVAHDFNNLLTVIVGNLEMMRPRLGSKARCLPLLVEAEEAARLGARLAERLLAVGRRQRLKPVVFDVGQMAIELADILKRTLGESIVVDVSAVETGLGVKADMAQLQSALINIAVNARDAMPHGGRLSIEVRRLRRDERQRLKDELTGRDFVVIAVKDEGTGMLPEVASRAFEPFFTTKQSGVATGLGLSMVYGFARQSRGIATIDSKPGEGTTVKVILPREVLEGRPKSAAAPAQRRPPRDRNGHLVLVVEDNDRVRRVTCARLKDLGYRVVEAADGVQALEVFRKNPQVEVIVSDVVMPNGINGPALLTRLRSIDPAIRCVFISGYANPLQYNDEGETDAVWLGKPHSRAELAGALRQALGLPDVNEPEGG